MREGVKMLRCFALATVLVAAGAAHAVVLGGSNLDFMGYPEAKCIKPEKPTKPFTRDSWAVNSYNLQVDSYNAEFDVYISCVKKYLENANNDIERIRESMKKAIDRAKQDY